MNKENDNVAWRLGSSNHKEHGVETMYSMPESTGENESIPPNNEAEVEGLFHSYAATIATLSAAFVGTIVISIIISRMWDEDTIKLHVLDALIKMLQGIARLCGGWAIECERTYNDYVNALH